MIMPIHFNNFTGKKYDICKGDRADFGWDIGSTKHMAYLILACLESSTK